MNVNRRTFLKASFLGSSTAFAGAVVSEVFGAITPRLPDAPTAVIDTHTHFYDPTRPQGVPWPGKEDKLLYGTVLPRDYKALPTPAPVTGTVVVEASAWLEDNQWILDLAAQDRFIVGFIGNLFPGTDDFIKHLKRFARNRLFRGIRIGGARLKAGLTAQRFRSDLRQLARRDLVLDLLGGPEMLPDVARLARELPTLRIVIDHVANVRIDGQQPPADWLRGIDSAAGHANVYCKVSGLVEGTGRTDGSAPRDVSFYQPVLDPLWNAFGMDRLIYGSNWPVSARFADLATVQSIVIAYCQGRGGRAVEAVFSRNAKRVYKWVTRVAPASRGH